MIPANSSDTLFIGFASKALALKYQEAQGGRIFVSHDDGAATWFSHKLTPSAIFAHQATKGLSGILL